MHIFSASMAALSSLCWWKWACIIDLWQAILTCKIIPSTHCLKTYLACSQTFITLSIKMLLVSLKLFFLGLIICLGNTICHLEKLRKGFHLATLARGRSWDRSVLWILLFQLVFITVELTRIIGTSSKVLWHGSAHNFPGKTFKFLIIRGLVVLWISLLAAELRACITIIYNTLLIYSTLSNLLKQWRCPRIIGML